MAVHAGELSAGGRPAPVLPRRPPGVASTPSRATLWVQRLATAGVIWSFMISIYAYKTLYIVAGVASAAVGMLILFGGLRHRSVVSVVAPLVVYFGWLMTTAFWAASPRVTLFLAMVDSIVILIAVLFYLLALNQPHRIGDIFIDFAFVAVPITAFIFLRDPDASRSGGYAISVLPFVPAFCWADIVDRRRRTRAVIALLITFAVLIFARSRTPILVAAFTTGLAVFVFNRGILKLIQRSIVALTLVALAFAGLVYFEPTRQVALITFSRFTHLDVHVGDVFVTAEQRVDPVRVNLHQAARAYGREYLFFGMGYGNFPSFFAQYWDPLGRAYTLHSSYETWWVEGGLVCLLIVTVMFIRQFRHLAVARRDSADPEIRRLARIMIVASLGIFLFGLFHQVQRSPMVYALIGISAALPRGAMLLRRKTKKAEHAAPPSPRHRE